MKKYISIFLVLVSSFVFSQTILNAKSPEEYRKMTNDNMKIVGDSVISNKVEPLKYGFIDDKDVLKSIYVWEIIDMNDKINQPLYYDNTDALSAQNKSLYTILLDAALTGKIKEIYDDENFKRKLTVTEVEKRLVSKRVDDALIDIYNSGRQPTQAEIDQYTDIIKTTSDKVRMLKMMGMWYIDARDGLMKYRPLGIAAMGPDPNTAGKFGPDGKLLDNNELIELFWVYYPDAREILANKAVFNRKNTSADLSFDDVINARRFTSIIYKSSNGLGEGLIKDYIPRNSDDQIEESDRIKGEILKMENEMWNY